MSRSCIFYQHQWKKVLARFFVNHGGRSCFFSSSVFYSLFVTFAGFISFFFHFTSRRKSLTIEIEQMNGRLADAEARLKAEVLRIKKKMQVTITELEMSLDVANKSNIDLQKQIKKLSLQVADRVVSLA